MFGIKEIKRDIVYTKNNIDNLFVLFREVKNDVKGVFKEDRHGTKRPKVDMLNDLYTELGIQVWNALNELQKRIEKLEKK